MQQAPAGNRNKNIYFGFLLLTVLCIGFMFAEVINNRFWLSDFEVYYKAAQRISASENLYQHVEDKHYVFKYSPTSALFFIPFTFFSFTLSKYIYWCFLTILIVSGFYLCIKNIQPSVFVAGDKKTINSVVMLAMVILAVHFLRELHLGQVNYLLLFIYIFSMHCLNRKRETLSAVLLGASVFIKPFALIFLPYFIVKQKYREALWFILSIALFSLLPVLFYGSPHLTVAQYELWFHELQVELAHKQGLLADANHTIFSVVARYTPVRHLLKNSSVSRIYQVCFLLVIAGISFYFIKTGARKDEKEESDSRVAMDFAMLSAWIPLLAFTSENAFIYTQILIFCILLHFKNLRSYEKVLAITGFLFIGGNFSELIGKKLSGIADNISLISIGTVILLYLLFMLRTSTFHAREVQSQ